MRAEVVWLLAEVADNNQTFRYLREGLVEADKTFGGVAPPDKMLTSYESEAKQLRSEHEAAAFAKRHEMAQFRHGYQSEAHLSPRQVLLPTCR